MIFKLIEEGEFCSKCNCVAGSPKFDRCPRNFGLKIEHLYRKDHKGGTDRQYVKCASWMPMWLAEAIKNW